MIPQIPASELAARGSTAVLIDVREDDEYAAARIAGSLHIPMSSFVQRIAEVPKDETVYIICAAGVRSAQVAAYLGQQGYDAVNVDGGLTAWQQAGLPVEHGH
jgi:rhodanese-related sulfurtransferase